MTAYGTRSGEMPERRSRAGAAARPTWKRDAARRGNGSLPGRANWGSDMVNGGRRGGHAR